MASHAFVSTVDDVDQALEGLTPQATAIDRVVSGVLAAAALRPGVLLGPARIFVGGPGIGARVIEGPCRQPGLGAPRPRGFVPGDEPPPAAYVAVPGLPATLATALSLAQTLTTGQIVRPAVALAKKIDRARAEVLETFGRQGGALLGARAIAEALVKQGGRVAGGTLTSRDLESARGELGEALERAHGELRAALAPAEDDSASVTPAGDVLRRHACVAIDGRGRLAVCEFAEAVGGVPIAELGLEAPRLAVPVRRGSERAKPGAPIGFPSRAALLGAEGAWVGALAVAGRRSPASSGTFDEVIAAYLSGKRVSALGEGLDSGDALVAVRRGPREPEAFATA